MKSYLLSIPLFLFASYSIAQSQATIYLKDGTMTKGNVLINDSTGFVMVISADNGYHYFLKSQIDKIEKTDSVKSKRHHTYTLKSKGYLCNIEIGGTEIIAKGGGTNLPAFSFDVINSYLISPYASIGMGIGTDLAGSNIEMLGLYANSRLYFIKSDISPFLDLSLGYNAMFATGSYGDFFGINTTSHGMIANPSLGIRVAACKKLSLTASIGFKLYYLRNAKDYDTFDNLFDENADRAYSLGHALTIKVGFQF